MRGVSFFKYLIMILETSLQIISITFCVIKVIDIFDTPLAERDWGNRIRVLLASG